MTMIKAYLKVVELIRKDGTPFRRLHIMAHDDTTGEIFQMFDLRLSPLDLALWDILIEKGKIKPIIENWN